MGFYAMSMAAIASLLRRAGRPTEDLWSSSWSSSRSSRRLSRPRASGTTTTASSTTACGAAGRLHQSVKVRSIVGILPPLAVAVVDDAAVDRVRTVHKRAANLLDERRAEITRLKEEGALAHDVGEGRLLLGVVGLERVLRLFDKLFDEDAFLSPYGIRAVSRYHLEHPFTIEVDGHASTIDYEPAESTTGMFGGNSNWRGPIWMPVNYLIVNALARYARFLGSDYTRRVSEQLGESAHARGDRGGPP